MILLPHETEQFYRIWWALLYYVNSKQAIVPELRGREPGPTEVQLILPLREALWSDDGLREAFIAENPARLSAEELAIAASWDRRVEGDFYIFRFLRKHTLFLSRGTSTQVFGVLGLASPLEEIMQQPPPILVHAVLLPFGDKIIYDSILNASAILFGPGIRESMSTAYRQAKEHDTIITTLAPEPAVGGAEELRKDIQARNLKLLNIFRKNLARAGLSSKMVELHAKNIQLFAESYLLAQDRPCALLDLSARDIETYLTVNEATANVTSFKRFVRFLYNTARIEPDHAWEMQEFFKTLER